MLNEYELGYLIGLIAGEGCFHISILDQREKNWKVKQHTSLNFEIRPQFKMNLHKDDEDSLKFVQKCFGFGTIYSLNNCHKQFYVSGLKRCKIIKELISTRTIIGKKSKDFLIWCQIISLMEEKQHLTKKGLSHIIKLRSQMNKTSTSDKSINYRREKYFQDRLTVIC